MNIVVPGCATLEISPGLAAFNASRLTPHTRATASSDAAVPAVTRDGQAACAAVAAKGSMASVIKAVRKIMCKAYHFGFSEIWQSNRIIQERVAISAITRAVRRAH